MSPNDVQDCDGSESEDDILWVVGRRRMCQIRQVHGVGNDGQGALGGPEHKASPSLASRSRSTPCLSPASHFKSFIDSKGGIPWLKAMLAAPAVDITFDDDNWLPPQSGPRLYRAASVGNSWGVTSIGRGFDWKDDEPVVSLSEPEPRIQQEPRPGWASASTFLRSDSTEGLSSQVQSPKPLPAVSSSLIIARGPLNRSPVQSRPASPLSIPPSGRSSSYPSIQSGTPHSPSSSRASPVPRTRRRSSQQRVSTIAGRVSIIPVEPPSPPPTPPQKLVRTNSTASFLSAASSVEPPTPGADRTSWHSGERSISEFVIEREIGRGAYGLVKRAREMNEDGSLGPPLIIKQIIKSRILADCWKRHPKFGTIPIEIYVMSAISSTRYVLPPRRPWHPTRADPAALSEDKWIEGKTVYGHPNICPLIDFFEDNHYYYLILPCTTPEPQPDQPPPPSDLFDLVETYPNGLPPRLIRSYLGQMADALCFLHAKGIVHRDIKDENVVLGPAGKCVLIDFGSAGLVKKGGWDTFSGTLDYAGPEILRGERYQGKEQDVWAFGVVAYVMLVGECPFTTAAEAQEGLESPFSTASMALDERCLEGKEEEEEADGGGILADASALVRACLRVEVAARPTFEKILQCRFLSGGDGWGFH
ncbi:unnamed protein product [Somion occarium]|uniref:Protein kinase domain-containing protein n=1 Tax=Somion occarium TaxID=3059160 RepID=A0ABP1CMJ3_9APHY